MIHTPLYADLLYGPKDGGFQFNKVLTVASRTSDGVVSSRGALGSA